MEKPMNLRLVYSSEHATYGTVKPGHPVPFGWHVVAEGFANEQQARQWVWDQDDAWASLDGFDKPTKA